MTKAVTINQLDLLDKELDELFTKLKNFDNSALNQKPADGGWSVIQVLHHLILAEGGSARYIKKKLSFNPKLGKAGFMAAWRLLVVNVSFMLPIKYKAPKGVGDESLPGSAELETTRATWQAQREELRQLLSELPDTYFDKELYKHPLAGKMSLNQMLKFFRVHIRRHQPQINRLLKKAS